MTIEQERAAFEAWAASIGLCVTGKYAETIDVLCAESAFKAGYQAGRTTMQSQEREDAERLDWLEEQAQTSRTGVSIDYVYNAEDGYVTEKGYRFMRHRFIGPLGRSAREAIDHARRAKGRIGDD